MRLRDAEGRRPWWWFWVRDLTVLIVVVEFLAWAVGWEDPAGDVLKHWPLFVGLAVDATVLVWSVGRIYRGGASKLTLPIAGLILSVLGLLIVILACEAWMSRVRRVEY